MFAARCLANRHAFAKKGYPAQKTTGVVSAHCIQCKGRERVIAMPAKITGTLRTLDHTKRFLAKTTRFFSFSINFLRCESVSMGNV